MKFRRMTLCDVFLEAAERLGVDARRATYQLDLAQVGASAKLSGSFRPDPGAGPFFATGFIDRQSSIPDDGRTTITVGGRVVVDMLGNFLCLETHESLAAPLFVPGQLVSVEYEVTTAATWKATIPGFHVTPREARLMLQAFGGQAWLRSLGLLAVTAGQHRRGDFVFDRPTFLSRIRSDPFDSPPGELFDPGGVPLIVEEGFARLALVNTLGERQELLVQPYRDTNLARQIRINRHLPPGARLEAEIQNLNPDPRALLIHMTGTQPW